MDEVREITGFNYACAFVRECVGLLARVIFFLVGARQANFIVVRFEGPNRRSGVQGRRARGSGV